MPKSRVEFWQKKFDDNVRRDQLVRETLENHGIRCLVVWECTITKMQKDRTLERKVVDEIFDLIKKQSSGTANYSI